MESTHQVHVVAPDGAVGRIDTSAWPLDGSRDPVLVQFAGGRQQMVPLADLKRQPGGDYVLSDRSGSSSESSGGSSAVVPIVQEQVHVDKRTVETGRVQIRKVVHEEEQVIDPVLLRTDVVVERVPINRPIESLPPVRQEGQTTIVPLVEEMLVVEKRLVLREELRITRHTSEYHNPQRVVVRREEAEVKHVPGSDENVHPGTGVAPSLGSDAERQERRHHS